LQGIRGGKGQSGVVAEGIGGKGVEMTQTLYVHMNKLKIFKNIFWVKVLNFITRKQ
jgi:hypothetical protein